MNHRVTFLLRAFTCAILLAVTAGSTGTRAAGERYLLTLSDDSTLDDVLARHDLELKDAIEGTHVYRIEDSLGRSEKDLENELLGDLEVFDFELDGAHVLTEIPQAQVNQSTAAILEAVRKSTPVPYYGASVPSAYVTQPASKIIGLANAQAAGGTGQVTVAVIDTGVDPDHPVLKGVLTPGYDFTRDLAGSASELIDLNQSTAAILEQSTSAILEGDTVAVLNQSTAAILEQSTAAILESLPPAFGHGTMVAGLVHLVAPTARIMPLKAFTADGTSQAFDLVRAIYYAVDHGARVINMSWSMPERSRTLDRAIEYARVHGVALVTSVGNAGRLDAVAYPALTSGVLGIASTSNSDKRSTFSNSGDRLVFEAAPGEALITTYPGGNYAAAWGTSFSAAVVSGGAGLLAREVAPELAPADNDAVKSALQKTKKLTSDLGRGRLDLQKAVANKF